MLQYRSTITQQIASDSTLVKSDVLSDYIISLLHIHNVGMERHTSRDTAWPYPHTHTHTEGDSVRVEITGPLLERL